MVHQGKKSAGWKGGMVAAMFLAGCGGGSDPVTAPTPPDPPPAVPLPPTRSSAVCYACRSSQPVMRFAQNDGFIRGCE